MARKRSALSVDEVLELLDDDEPMMEGSDEEEVLVEKCVQSDLDDDDNDNDDDCGPSVAHDTKAVCPSGSGSRPVDHYCSPSIGHSDNEDMCGAYSDGTEPYGTASVASGSPPADDTDTDDEDDTGTTFTIVTKYTYPHL